MIKTFLTLGVIGVAGVASICDLCKPAPANSASSLVPVTYAALVAAQATPAPVPANEPRTARLKIEGMTCGGCVIGVRRVLTRLDGVRSAEVSYENKEALVIYDPAKVTVEQMIAAIKTLGYKAMVVTT